jgi:hypothetical protein
MGDLTRVGGDPDSILAAHPGESNPTHPAIHADLRQRKKMPIE